jgi:hypothetical protein
MNAWDGPGCLERPGSPDVVVSGLGGGELSERWGMMMAYDG